MFANRYTAFLDASTLAGTLRRNLILSLAEAELFRLRWSRDVLGETEKAIEKILRRKSIEHPAKRAARARMAMETAFQDAEVSDFDVFLDAAHDLPDPNDAHVVAAALKTQAAVIVTENLRHFPNGILARLNLEARSGDAFIADAIALDPGRAIAAIKRMRERFSKPEMTADILILEMEAQGLVETVDALRSFARLM